MVWQFGSWGVSSLWCPASVGGGEHERKTVFSLNLTGIVRTETYPGTLDSIFLMVVFDWRWVVAGETSRFIDQGLFLHCFVDLHIERVGFMARFQYSRIQAISNNQRHFALYFSNSNLIYISHLIYHSPYSPKNLQTSRFGHTEPLIKSLLWNETYRSTLTNRHYRLLRRLIVVSSIPVRKVLSTYHLH